MYRKMIFALLFSSFLTACSWGQEFSITNENPRQSKASSYRHCLSDIYKSIKYSPHKNSYIIGLEKYAWRPDIASDLKPENYNQTQKAYISGPDKSASKQIICEPGDKVTILHAKGQGSLRHIWTTFAGLSSKDISLEFYVDGEKEPSIKSTIEGLVTAALNTKQSFVPLAASIAPKNSYNLYLPIPFQHSLRVEIKPGKEYHMIFLQVDYRVNDNSMHEIKLVQTGGGDIPVFNYEGKTISRRNKPVSQIEHINTTITGNGTVQIDGTGIIRRLAINKSGNVNIRIYFDGCKTAAVNVDAADFFGPFAGTAINNNQCFLPMPFGKNVKFEISGSDPDAEWVINLDIEPKEKFEKNWRYFHSKHTKAEDKTTGYRPFEVLNTKGKGHWIGMMLYDTVHDHGGGDFTIIDGGTDQPDFLHGINGEDYFSFAWFGKGKNLPFSEAFTNQMGRMRIHLENPYPFEESINVSFGTLEGQSPRGVSLWYQDTPDDLTLEENRTKGLKWQVFGPVNVPVLSDEHTPDTFGLEKLFSNLPDEAALDAGRTFKVTHYYQRKEFAAVMGWQSQYAIGHHLNLMYIYSHIMNLGHNTHMTSYARAMMAKTVLKSKTDQKIQFQLSYDDPIAVYLNDELIFSTLSLKRGFRTSKIDASLRKGQNKLLIKLLDTPNNNLQWAGFSVRILDNEGNDISEQLQESHDE